MKMSEYFEFQFATRLQNPRVSYLDKKQTKFKNESAEQKRALCLLKEMIGASKDLALRDKSCCGDDEFLTRFLYARKFKCPEAFDLIVNYHSYKQKNRALLQKLTIFDEILQLAIRDGFPSIVKERDRRGRKVIIFIASNWDPGLYSIEVIYRSFLLSLEKLLEDRQNQSQGFVVIVDWTNFSMRQSTYLTPKVLRLMIEGLQDCFPAKFKAVHFIGQPWYVEVALAVIKPFLREKTKERIKMHGGNLSTLHECVPKDILPTELGGEGPNLNPLDWYHILVESSQTKEAPKTYIMTETTVYSMVPIATKNKISSEKIDNNLQ